ncbi:immunity 53 family protein [Chryseobacterium sp. GP-SGM7]|uniref:immunity 53 family protein n=1 Tax=Chryseobacterium sp. GP-SGM7 TaxID=3411323 RepID=UPI003B95CA78
MINWLQKWFNEQIDGNWEHEAVLKIETIDNPGWSLEVNLVQGSIPSTEWKLFEVSDDNWVGYKFEDNTFHASGDPNKLSLLIGMFKELVEKSFIEDDFIKKGILEK